MNAENLERSIKVHFNMNPVMCVISQIKHFRLKIPLMPVKISPLADLSFLSALLARRTDSSGEDRRDNLSGGPRCRDNSGGEVGNEGVDERAAGAGAGVKG